MPARTWETGATRTVTVEEDVQVLEISLKDGSTPPPPEPEEAPDWGDVLRPEAVFEARADATAVATEMPEGRSSEERPSARPEEQTLAAEGLREVLEAEAEREGRIDRGDERGILTYHGPSFMVRGSVSFNPATPVNPTFHVSEYKGDGKALANEEVLYDYPTDAISHEVSFD